MSADTRPRDRLGRFTGRALVFDAYGRVVRVRSRDGCLTVYQWDNPPATPARALPPVDEPMGEE